MTKGRRAFSGNDGKFHQSALDHLALILRFDLVFSLVLALIAPWYTSLLVRILLGSRWSHTSIPAILAAYSLQIPFMAFCGNLESFINATITPDWYAITRASSIGFSVLYMGAAVVLVGRWDVVGLIAAGILSFGLRATLGAINLRKFLQKNKDLSF